MRAAIYCRLSDEDRNKISKEEESESIQNQKSLLLEYCLKQNWEVVGIYCDEDMSGADRDRPQFQKMLSACQNGLIDVVLCKTLSRFSRDIEVVEHYIHNRFFEWGVRFVGVLDHTDTQDTANKKSRQIHGLVNEWYLEDLSENIKKTLRHKKEKGIFTGAFAPYGYRLDKEKRGKLFVDEIAAPIVRDIYRRYLAGQGYIKIAQELNRNGIPCPSEYKRLQGSRFYTHKDMPTSSIWSASTIRQILTNPVYIGNLVQGKTETISYKNQKRRHVNPKDYIVVNHTHDAIVEKTIWEKVQYIIGSHRRPEKQSGSSHVFAGKIFCAVCGSSMWKMSHRMKEGRYEYLKCKATKCGVSICENTPSIRFDAVYESVRAQMKHMVEQYFEKELFCKKIRNNCRKIVPNDTLQQIEQKILKQNLNIKQLYKDKLDGIIDYEIYCDLYQDIKRDISFLQAQRLALQTKTEKTHTCDAEKKVDALLQNIAPDNATVSALVDKILIGKPEDDSRSITICWKF